MSASRLEVLVNGRPVAALTSDDGLQHHLTYYPDTRPEEFVSLVMPVRAETWTWPTLHPFFQINLPEGFLLSALKERLGPHLGSRPLDVLAVIGWNMIGRVEVAAGRHGNRHAPFDLNELLHGNDSREVFMELVGDFTASGVSGVVPKFLSPETRSRLAKGSVTTERYIIKSSADRLPFLALNEHLSMRAARRAALPVAKTEVSDDGQVIAVERFDVLADGTRLGFEDCCSLLGLPPEDKYESTWERVSRCVMEFVATDHLPAAREQLALTLLLTYALGNADCHTKNLAVVYSSDTDIRLAPAYDVLSILAYDSYARNPPAMFVGGRKSWDPGQTLWHFLQQQLQFEPARQRELVDRVCQAVAETFGELIESARHVPGFLPVAQRMMHEWSQGISRLAPRMTITVPDFDAAARSAGLALAAAAPTAARRLGESELLGRRGRRDQPS